MIRAMQLAGVLGLAMLTAGCGAFGGHSGQAAATSSSSLSLSAGAVKQMQTALHSKGFYGGPIDGVLGPETRAALANYQQSEGRPRTATLDEQTLRSLIGTQAASNAPSGSSTPSGTQPETSASAGNQTSASGSSTPPSRMAPDQIRNQLQAQGYSHINDLRPWGNDDYTAKADRNGQTYLLEVDGHTGQIFSAQ